MTHANLFASTKLSMAAASALQSTSLSTAIFGCAVVTEAQKNAWFDVLHQQFDELLSEVRAHMLYEPWAFVVGIEEDEGHFIFSGNADLNVVIDVCLKILRTHQYSNLERRLLVDLVDTYSLITSDKAAVPALVRVWRFSQLQTKFGHALDILKRSA